MKYRHTATGATIYGTVRSEAGTYWNVATSALETLDPTHWYNAGSNRYNVAMNETPASSYYYVGTFPATAASGHYYIDVYVQAGAGPAISDPTPVTISGYWDKDAAAFYDDGWKFATEQF